MLTGKGLRLTPYLEEILVVPSGQLFPVGNIVQEVMNDI
jgi:hypothetical protein